MKSITTINHFITIILFAFLLGCSKSPNDLFNTKLLELQNKMNELENGLGHLKYYTNTPNVSIELLSKKFDRDVGNFTSASFKVSGVAKINKPFSVKNISIIIPYIIKPNNQENNWKKSQLIINNISEFKAFEIDEFLYGENILDVPIIEFGKSSWYAEQTFDVEVIDNSIQN